MYNFRYLFFLQISRFSSWLQNFPPRGRKILVPERNCENVKLLIPHFPTFHIPANAPEIPLSSGLSLISKP